MQVSRFDHRAEGHISLQTAYLHCLYGVEDILLTPT